MKIVHKNTSYMESNDRQRLIKGILHVSHLIKRHQETILGDYGLNISKFNILQILANEFPAALSQNQIKEKLTDKTIDMPRLIKKLDEMGLVSRVRNKESQLLRDLTITPKGMEAITAINQCTGEMNLPTIHITDEEVRQTMDIMQRMTRVMQQSPDNTQNNLDRTVA